MQSRLIYVCAMNARHFFEYYDKQLISAIQEDGLVVNNAFVYILYVYIYMCVYVYVCVYG